MNTNIVDYLLNNLRGAHLVSGNREINCNCPICGDSETVRRSTRKGGHFYISVPRDDKPMFYQCKRAVCQASGIVTHNKLIEWSLPLDRDIAIEVAAYNSKVFKNPMNMKFKGSEVYRLYNRIKDSDMSKVKLEYINKRLGLSLDYNDLMNNKITLNLKDVLSYNNITQFTRHKNIIDQLDMGFIGFISNDNAFINCRKLIDDGMVYEGIDYKYVKYNIFGKMDNSASFYTIPNSIDITRHITLRVAEGPFDILGIRYNILDNNIDNTILTSVQGSNYLGCIKWYLLQLASPDIDIHIYLDADIKDSYVSYITYQLKGLLYPVYIHRNLLEKDMGVRKKQIKESIIQII